MKILVVDDNFNNLIAAEDQLGQNHELVTVLTYGQAVALIKEQEWDVVMTDLMMPVEELGDMAYPANFEGQEMPYGLILALLAQQMEVPNIFIVTMADHHEHPIAWALDQVEGGNLIQVYGNNCPVVKMNGERVKNWAAVLPQPE